MPAFAADDENDAVLFEKIKKGEYDADDPIWDQVSLPAKDLVVRFFTMLDTLSWPAAYFKGAIVPHDARSSRSPQEYVRQSGVRQTILSALLEYLTA